MPRVAIYARVSTQDQHLDPQLAPLRAYAERRGAEAVPFTDKASGARARRPGLDALLDACRRREVEAVVIVKLDRLARSVRHLCEVVAELDSLGIALVALDQAIDTRSASGRLLIHTLGAVAEFERELVVERTKAGLAAARRRGARLGRRPSLDPRALARARRMRAGGQSLRHIASVLGVGKSTVARALAS